MRILVDENIPRIAVGHLLKMGHDLIDVRTTPEEGLSDEGLWNKAQQAGCLLITTDKGFARRRHMTHCGMLIVLLRQPNRDRITQRIVKAMGLFGPDEWPGLLVIMRDTVVSTWRTQARQGD